MRWAGSAGAAASDTYRREATSACPVSGASSAVKVRPPRMP